MRRKAIFLFILLLTITVVLQVKIPITKAQGTITVPDNYPTIQGALNNAQSGDTIYVKTGTYNESIIFPDGLSNISIQGENEYSTILNGSFTFNGYYSSNIQLTSLTITGGISVSYPGSPTPLFTFSGCYLNSGFYAEGGEYVFIGNTINGGVTIFGRAGFYSSGQNVIENNIFQNCGITFEGLSAGNNLVTGNTITNATVGITTAIGGDSIENNWVKNCGVGIQGSAPSEDIEANTLEFNAIGLTVSFAQGSLGSTIVHNNFLNNTDQVINSAGSSYPLTFRYEWNDSNSGNYWSDYNGTDANHNGIGDTPYVIDSNNQDNYPLMTPYSNSFVNPNIDASAGAGGSINPNGYVYVNSGGSQTFTITANPNFHIVNVNVDGNPVGAISSYSFTNVQAAHTITASFAINTFTIAVTQRANGQISPGTSNINYGSSQTFAITPNIGYHIASLTVDGSPVAVASSYTFSNVQTAHTISATFAINTYTITVTQTANGVIMPGTSTVNYGDTPSFTITPNTGYHIATITANGASITVTSPTGQIYQFTAVSVGGSLTATFAINIFTITVTQTSNGQITPGTTAVNYEGSQTFTITPNNGYYIASITTDVGSVSVTSPSGQTVSFTNVQATHTITATFTQTTSPTPSPSPTPAPTSTPTPSPTPSPTISPTPSPSPTPTPTTTSSTTPTPTSSPTPASSPTPTTTPTTTPNQTNTVTPTPKTTSSPTQTSITSQVPTETPSQSPSATSSPGTIVFSLSIVLIAFIALLIFLAAALYFRNRNSHKNTES